MKRRTKQYRNEDLLRGNCHKLVPHEVDSEVRVACQRCVRNTLGSNTLEGKGRTQRMKLSFNAILCQFSLPSGFQEEYRSVRDLLEEITDTVNNSNSFCYSAFHSGSLESTLRSTMDSSALTGTCQPGSAASWDAVVFLAFLSSPAMPGWLVIWLNLSYWPGNQEGR